MGRSNGDFGDFPGLFSPRLDAFELRPGARHHESSSMLAPGEDHSELLFCRTQSHRRVSARAATLYALSDTRFDYVSRPESQVHLDVAPVKVSHVLLLNEACEDCGYGLLTDGKDVDFGKPVLDLGHSSVNLVTRPRLESP